MTEVTAPPEPVSLGVAPQPAQRRPGVARAGHLVLTVGGSPVPVLLTLLGLRPARVTAVVSAASAGVWGRVWQSYLGLEPAGAAVAHDVVEVPAFDAAAVDRAVTDVAADGRAPFDLGYSGGSPAMTAGAFGAWWAAFGARSADSGVGAWYVAEEGDALIRHDGLFVEAGDVMAGRHLTLAAMVRLHGLEPAGLVARPEAWEPYPCPTDHRAVRKALRQLPETGDTRDRERLQAAAVAAALDSIAVIGGAAGLAVHAPVRVLDTSPDGRLGEASPLGICLVQGLALRMIEVAGYRRKDADAQTLTRRWKASWLKEALFDAEVRARRAGGVRTDTALMSLEASRPNETLAVETLWRDIGPLSTPPRLAFDGESGVPQLPSTTAFGLPEVYEALRDLERGVAVADGNDLVRWVCGVTE